MDPAVAWQVTFQAYPHMVFLLDDRERIRWMNSAACRALRCTLDDMLGRFAAEIIWGQRAPQDVLKARARKKRRIEHEIIEVARLDEFWDITKTPFRDDQGKIVGTLLIARDVTESHRAEEALHESEKRYRDLVDAIREGLGVIDEWDVIQYCNPALARIFEVPADHLVGSHLRDFLDKDSWREFEGQAPARRSSRDAVYELTLWTGQGNERRIQMNASPHYDMAGKYLGASILVQDITRRKQAEEALRESEERFRDLANLLPQTVFEVDLEGNFKFVNRHALQATGYTQEDFEKSLKADLLNIPEDRGRTRENIGKILTGEDIGGIEYTALRKDGTTYPILVCASAIIREGKPVGLRGIVTDVTDLKHAERALQREKDTAQMYLDMAGTILVAIDADRKITLIDRKGCEILGYTADELIGKNWFDTCLPQGLKKNVEAVFVELLAGDIEPVEHFGNPVVTKSGEERTIAWHNTVLRDENGDINGVLSSGEDITERKKAEATLRESEQKFRSITNTAKDAIVIIDSEGRISHWNPEAERMFGYAPHETLGRQMLTLLAPERYHEAFHKGFSLFIKTGQGPAVGKTMELEAIRKGGTEFPIEISLSTIEVKGEWHAVGIVRDITERKCAEEALRESEQRFRTIVETAPSLLLIADAQGNNIYISPNCEEFTGYTQEELRGKVVWWVHAEDTPRAREAFDESFRNGVAGRNFEYKAVKKNGELWYASSSWQPLRDENGKFRGIVVQTIDITERKRAEDARHESEERYRILFNSGRDLVFVTDMTGEGMPGTIIEVNDFACQRLGYTREELSHLSVLDLTPPHELEAYRPLVGKLLGDKELIFETVVLAKDGTEIPVEISVDLFELKRRPLLLSVARDITGRRRAEETLRETQEKYRKLTETKGW
jgi:PAS domain S-box-containing protein